MSIYAYIGIIIIFLTTIIHEKCNKILAVIFLVVAFIVEVFIIYNINNTPTAPTALDVYQGNTELRITYEGKVPVDSVVIFKKKAHETK